MDVTKAHKAAIIAAVHSTKAFDGCAIALITPDGFEMLHEGKIPYINAERIVTIEILGRGMLPWNARPVFEPLLTAPPPSFGGPVLSASPSSVPTYAAVTPSPNVSSKPSAINGQVAAELFGLALTVLFTAWTFTPVGRGVWLGMELIAWARAAQVISVTQTVVATARGQMAINDALTGGASLKTFEEHWFFKPLLTTLDVTGTIVGLKLASPGAAKAYALIEERLAASSTLKAVFAKGSKATKAQKADALNEMIKSINPDPAKRKVLENALKTELSAPRAAKVMLGNAKDLGAAHLLARAAKAVSKADSELLMKQLAGPIAELTKTALPIATNAMPSSMVGGASGAMSDARDGFTTIIHLTYRNAPQ